MLPGMAQYPMVVGRRVMSRTLAHGHAAIAKFMFCVVSTPFSFVVVLPAPPHPKKRMALALALALVGWVRGDVQCNVEQNDYNGGDMVCTDSDPKCQSTCCYLDAQGTLDHPGQYVRAPCNCALRSVRSRGWVENGVGVAKNRDLVAASSADTCASVKV